nr:FAD-dependent oxidoreductase [Ammoniphilus resinae]
MIVLGGGAGGLTAAAGAASLGAAVALVYAGPLGGDCLWTGCVPTKSLIHSAEIIHQSRGAAEFGLDFTGVPNFEQVQTRMQEAIEQIGRHDDPNRFRQLGVDLYQGFGSFMGPHEITINSETIYGKRIVISTGSRPFIPQIPGLDQVDYLTNENVLQLDERPHSLLIIGGGPIGVEFAQSFARFGTEVTVVEQGPMILSKEDDELVPFVARALERENIRLMTNAVVSSVNDSRVTIMQNGQESQVSVDRVFVAVGREPNTKRLHLENAGIRTAANGSIEVNDYLQTNVPHIYAVGDVNGRYPFTHTAGYEGKIVVSNALFGWKRKANYQHLPWVTYSDPELFHLGLTEKEARETIGAIRVYKVMLDEVDRFVINREREGMIKIITDRKGYILGAHAVADGAGEFMQEVVFAKQHGHKIGDLSHVIHPYPTKAGAVQQVADLYWRERLFSGQLTKWVRRYLKWFR